MKFWDNVHPPNMSCVTCHVSHVTCHNVSRITCHVSHVTCHMSHVTCHISHVTCHIFFFWQSGEAYRWRVCYQRGLPRLVLTLHGEWMLINCFLQPVFWVAPVKSELWNLSWAWVVSLWIINITFLWCDVKNILWWAFSGSM